MRSAAIVIFLLLVAAGLVVYHTQQTNRPPCGVWTTSFMGNPLQLTLAPDGTATVRDSESGPPSVLGWQRDGNCLVFSRNPALLWRSNGVRYVWSVTEDGQTLTLQADGDQQVFRKTD